MRLGIRAKLFAGFGAVLLLLLGVGGYGLWELNRVAGELQSLGDHTMAAAVTAQDANVAMMILQRDVRNAIIVTSDADNVKTRASYDAAEKRLAADITKLEALIVSTEGKEKLAALQKATAAWQPVRSRVLDAALKNEGDLARQLLLEDQNVRAIADVNTAIDGLVSFEDQLAATTMQDARSDAALARSIMLALMGLAVAIGMAVAYFISQGISSGVKAVQITLTSLTDRCATALVNGLGAFAQNDLTVKVVPVTPPIEKYGTDEIGETARVTNLMRDKLVATISSYEQARAGLQEIVNEVQVAATGVAGTSDQLGQAASQTSGVVQQVTQAIQNVAAGSGEASRSAQSSNEAVSQLGQAID
ncbi:MAG: MCP four helix bundle domain-containing protein, partial [Chloroflexota bacterium]